MKYIIRSFKYLVYFFALFVVMVAIIWLLSPEKSQSLSVTSLFKEGSLPKMAVFFAAIAAVYPALAFIRRKLFINGSFADERQTILNVFDAMGYEVEREEDGQISFRIKKRSVRFSRMWEDRIILHTGENPLVFEGYRKDLDRIVRNVSYAISRREASSEEGAAE